jgi:DNA-binding MarR family transcriptional regulator/ribosomal protein S18 acetylase RimI-like enzyme
MPDPDVFEAIRAFNRFYTNKLGVLAKGYLNTTYTLTEARILYEMGARRQVSATGLNRDLGLDPAYLSRIIKKFREAGFLVSEPDPADGRSQILSVTDQGQAEYERLGTLSRQQIAGELAGVAPQERDTLIASMASIRIILEPATITSVPTDTAPVVIREHRIGDMGWIIETQATAYANEYGWNEKFEGLLAEVAGKFIANFNPDRERCWIAEKDGRRVGSVLVADGGNGTAKLRLLYLDPAARGLGLGRTLVEQCIAFSTLAAYDRLLLWTNDVLTAAIRIYETAGFRLVAEEEHAMFGPACIGQTWELDLEERRRAGR